MFGAAPRGNTYRPFISIDNDNVKVRGITRRGNDYYLKASKSGSSFVQEIFIGSATGKGSTRGTIFGTTFFVDWERE